MGCFFEGADDVSSGDFECGRSFADLPYVFRHMRENIPDMHQGSELWKAVPTSDTKTMHGRPLTVSETL